MPTLIQSFPAEIIDEVAQLLSVKELCMLRLSCKELEAKSRYHFAPAGFGRKSLPLMRLHLQRLEELSKHEIFRTQVHTLCFGMEHFTEGGLTVFENIGATEELLERYRELVEDQVDFRDSKTDVTMLTAILPRFPNLSSIRIYPLLRYLTSHPMAVYGIVPKYEQAEQYLSLETHTAEDAEYVAGDHAMAVLLEAIARSRISLDSLHAIGVPAVPTTLIALSKPQLKLLRPCFVALRSLSLIMTELLDFLTDDCPYTWLARFTALTPALEELRLRLGEWNFDELPEAASIIGQETEVLYNFSRTRPLSKLKFLRLEKFRFRAKDLSRLLRKHGTTLTELKISDANLVEGSWLDVLRGLKNMGVLQRLTIKGSMQYWKRVTFNDSSKKNRRITRDRVKLEGESIFPGLKFMKKHFKASA